MSAMRQKLAKRLAAEVSALLPTAALNPVVTDKQFVLDEYFPSVRVRFDVAILCVARLGQTERVTVDNGVPIFGLNIVSPETLAHDLIEIPNRLPGTTVGNYVVFDPTGEVLRPRLQAFTVTDAGLTIMKTAATDQYAHRLGFRLDLLGDELVVSASPAARSRIHDWGDSE